MDTLHHSRVYADVNRGRTLASMDSTYYRLIWTHTKIFVKQKIGEGTFGVIYKCQEWRGTHYYAIKVLKCNQLFESFKKEVMILKELLGCSNIIKYEGCMCRTYVGGPAIVLEYVEPGGYIELHRSGGASQIRFFMLQLLTAIDVCHRKGIIHRDIKPNNILIDMRQQRLRLIDFSVAVHYIPWERYSIHVGTRNYQAPELLLGYQTYDYSIDLFSFGVMFAELIFKIKHFINGKSRADALWQIIDLLGTNDLLSYINKYDIEVSPEVFVPPASRPAQHLSMYVNEVNKSRATEKALDLVQKLVLYDHQVRLTAAEAMEHPYFQEEESVSDST